MTRHASDRLVRTLAVIVLFALVLAPVGPAAAQSPHETAPPQHDRAPSRTTPTPRGAPVDPGPHTLVQPDGSTITAIGYGDAVEHGMESPDGYTILRGDDGHWRYARGRDAAGRLVESDRIVGSAPPVEGTEPHLRTAETTAEQEPPSSVGGIDGVGVHPTVVILVQFANQNSVGSTPADWASRFFGPTNSVRDYYDEVSYGKLDVAPAGETSGTNNGVIGWLTLPYNHPNYTNNYGDAERTLTRDAINAANPYINYAAFDANGDGELVPEELHITIIAAGYESGSANGAPCGPGIWGHRWTLPSAYVPRPDNVWVGHAGYTEFGEWHCSQYNAPGHMATVGIMAHEFGHDLGLPDLYDSGKAPALVSAGIGNWSLMAGGTWNRLAGQLPGTSPSHPDAWSKYVKGWTSPTPVTTAEAGATFPAAATSPTVRRLLDNANGVDWTWNGSGTGEYFLVENRQRVGYDAALPGCGLIVYHVDETRGTNQDESRRLVDVEEADGLNRLSTTDYRGSSADPYPGTSGNTVFNDSSTPNSRLNSGATSNVSVSVTSPGCASTMTADLSVGGVVRPANDAFASAIALTGAAGSLNGTNVAATKETGEPNHAGNAGGASVWYRWTAPASGTVALTTVGSTFDTTMAVYTGTAVGGLTPVASNDDENNGGGVYTSRIPAMTVAAGTTYRIAIDGYKGTGAPASGAAKIAWSLTTPAPANDAFAAAAVLTGSSGSTSGSNLSATKEAGEPNHADNAGGASIWHRWTAPSDGKLTVDTAGSPFDTTLGLYSGSAVGALSRLATNDDANNAAGVRTSRIADVPVTAGTTYSIAVDGYKDGTKPAETGSVTTAWAFTAGAAPPPNDPFVSAIEVAGWSGTASGSNIAATKEGGEPSHGTNVGGASIWYRWTAPADGKLTVDTRDSVYDTLLGIYTGTSVAGLTTLGGNDDENGAAGVRTSRVTDLPVTAGTVYRVAVDGYKSATAPPATGATTLHWSFAPTVPAVTNDAFASATALSGASGTSVSDNSTATKETGEPNHADNVGGRSLWWRWTAPSSGLLAVDTAGSPFDTVLAVYTGAAVNSLSVVASNDDERRLENTLTSRIRGVPVTAGTTYRIAVDGFNAGTGAASGKTELNWTFSAGAALPPNDAFASATVMSGAAGTAASSNVLATKEPSEPNHAGNAGGASVWFRWVAPSSGLLQLSTSGSPFDTTLGVYTGATVDALTLRASNDDEGGASGPRTSFLGSVPVVGGTTYRVAVDGYRNETADVEEGAVSLAWSLRTAPAAPSSVTASAGAGAATVSWAPPASDGGAAVSGYVVTPIVGGIAQAAQSFASTATTQVVTGLSNGTEYRFTVSATNAVGRGGESAASNAVTPRTVPGAPTFTSVSGGDGVVSLGWNPPSSNGGSAVTGYLVTVYQSGSPVRAASVNGLSTVIGSLTNGVPYQFTVRATNAAGTGPESASTAGVTPTAPVPPPAPPPPPAPAPRRSGYWMVSENGAVYAFGEAVHHGNAAIGVSPAEDLEPTPSGNGYWIVAADGSVQTFGDATFFGGANGSLRFGERATSLSATPRGDGYWLFTTAGRVLPFGQAPFLGDMSAVRLNGPVLDSISTPTGAGYFMVASDGGIFTFGDATFYGSMGGTRLNAPVQSLVPDGDGVGYWLVASDGGIFAFDAEFYGSMGATRLNRPVTGMVAFGSAGYLMVGEDGGIFSFGTAAFHGSLGDRPPASRVTSVAVLN